MANILFATLGESPIVVTAMIKALREARHIEIDQLYVIYPDGANFIDIGYELIKTSLQTEPYHQISVSAIPLPFDDPNTSARSIVFLQTTAKWLSALGAFGKQGDRFYISVAGGRKNMSALMLIPCQFAQSIQGIFHILDNGEEYGRPNFFSIEQLDGMTEETRLARMFPPIEQLELIEIDSKPFEHAEPFWEFLKNPAYTSEMIVGFEEKYFADTPDPTWLDFFKQIFQDHLPAEAPAIPEDPEKLDVYLSKTAVEQLQSYRGEESYTVFQRCLEGMQNRTFLDRHRHRLENASHIKCPCFKRGNSRERIFFHTQGHDIIACELLTHPGSYDWRLRNTTLPMIPSMYKKDFPLREVCPSSGTLFMAVGESPAIVSQSYTLLEQQGKQVKKIVVIYPGGNQRIIRGVEWLQSGFAQKAAFQAVPLDDLEDIRSREDSQTYFQTVTNLLREHRAAGDSIWLSISGGRKTMAVLTLLAAQAANVPNVYHTLITQKEIERDLTQRGSIDRLGNMSVQERNQFLFPEHLDPLAFELFTIPMILFKSSTSV